MEFLEQYSGILALILLIIALVCYLKFCPEKEEDEEEEETHAPAPAAQAQRLDLNDEDATVACLVAAIECREKEHKHVRIVSVKEVK